MQHLSQWLTPPPCYRAELRLDLPPEASFVYRSANNMPLLAAGSPLFSPTAFDGEYPSEDVIIAGDAATSRYILAGAITAKRSLSYFSLIKNGRFHSITVRQPGIFPGEEPEKLLILEGSDWRQLLQAYAARAAEAMGQKKLKPTENVTGYCSWYYYYAGVTEKNLNENLEALADPANRKLFPAKYLQIDDGYQTFQGDWLDQDETWPTPLPEIAAKIRAAGMIPGIWTMPFLASTSSRIFRSNPEWFVKSPDGTPLVFAGWSPPPDNHWVCLDATRQEVQEHLQKIFTTFRDWGFGYFKLDGMGFSLPSGIRYDHRATAVSAFRTGLKTIREAVPDCILLGCGAPFMPCLGLVDHIRVSNDTGREWLPEGAQLNCDANNALPCVANALHATLANWWMYDRWFRADPDALMARQDNTSCTEGEARLSVLSGILTGIAITSDNLKTIAPERLQLLAKAAKYRLHSPVPQLWRPDTWPQVFTGTWNGGKAACIFNDSDREMTWQLKDIGFSGAVEELLQDMGTLYTSITLPPHDGAFIAEKGD